MTKIAQAAETIAKIVKGEKQPELELVRQFQQLTSFELLDLANAYEERAGGAKLLDVL